ncbi:MAG: hypothetical protein OXF44_09310 [Anaerolineaceae bacterium]|nr:hypothetical protein [Anaerolineaceae bacterium]
MLSGDASGSESVRARALTVAAGDGPVAVLACGGDNEAAGRALEDFEDLGDRPVYLVDALTEDDDSLRVGLSNAGMVVVTCAMDPILAHDALSGVTSEGIFNAWEAGGLVLLEGPAAMCGGAWVVTEDREFRDALAWLPGTLVLPGMVDAAANEAARQLLDREQQGVALGIGENAALALGPSGELEIWGRQEVSIALGAAWQAV